MNSTSYTSQMRLAYSLGDNPGIGSPDVGDRCIPTKTGAEILIIPDPLARLCQPTTP